MPLAMAFKRVSLGMQRPLWLAAIVMPAAIFLFAAWFDFTIERREVEQQVRATTATLSEHAQTVFETTSLTLARVTDRIAGRPEADIQTSASLHDFMVMLRDDLPQIQSIFIVAADGRTLATTRQWPLRELFMVADRDYFTGARAEPDRPHVSAPFVSRLDPTLAFVISSAVTVDGRFTGIVGVTISPAYFKQFYASAVDYPGYATATILRQDGMLLFRYPEPANAMTKLPPGSTMVRAAALDMAEGRYAGISTIDGRSRVGAYRRLTNLPLWVSFSVDTAVYIRAWLFSLTFVAGFCLALAAILLLSERFVLRRAAAEMEASRRLASETDRRLKAELALEQMQKMEALGRLTGGVAHDFNNLLTAILGPLELAARRVSDPRVLRLLDTATQAAERGARLTAQMLAFARKRDAAVRLLDPNAVIQGIADMLARTLEPAVNVSFDLGPGAGPISADMVQLEVALLNLCVNARDAMPAGGDVLVQTRLIHLEAPESDLPPGPYVRLCVKDGGEGMTEAVRARAMEPFFTTKPVGKGTGLGLSTVYGLARGAGGTVSIESAPGAGTSIVVMLPVRAGEIPAEPPPPSPARRGACHRILLTDDDDTVRMVIAELLQELGHHVEEAASAEAALALVRSAPAFDILITDLDMPGLTGEDLARAVRRHAPHLPILFVTGFAGDKALEDWQTRNACILQKPFSAAALAQAVMAAVDGVSTPEAAH